MSGADISISELNQAERRFVVRAFLRSVGADMALTELARSKRQVPYEDVLGALNLSGWPNSETTYVELAWLSEPLCSSKFPRLCPYSVFGSLSTDVQLWIGKTPRKPVDGSFLLTGRVLLGAIIRIYQIKVVELGHPNPIVNFAKRNQRLFIRWGLPLMYLVGYLVYAYFRHGISLDTLFPVSTGLVSFFISDTG